MFRSNGPKDATAGFTLIEVLVALSIVAISLSSIGALVTTIVRGSRSIERHLIQLETMQAIATALPNRDQLMVGTFSGEIASHRWRVDVSPFITTNIGTLASGPWLPQAVVVTVQSPDGGLLQINTIRLRRRAGG